MTQPTPTDAKPTTVALVGVGGFGGAFVGPLLNDAAAHGVCFVAAVEPRRIDVPACATLAAAGVDVAESIDELFNRHRPDVVVLATPIHLHAPQTALALRHGAHVLVEKPLCATADEIEPMRQAAAAAGRAVGVGYQWSFSRSVLDLRADVLAGRLGAPRRLKSIALWPRGDAYYARNAWAGRQRTADGRAVFDSPVTNASAHFLHNIFFTLGLCGDDLAGATVTAETYRANPIDSYDTAALRCVMPGGVEALFVASHAVCRQHPTRLRYEFDDATVEYDDTRGGRIVARWRDGRTRDYGPPASSNDVSKLWSFVGAVRAGVAPACPLEAAVPHVIVADAVRAGSAVTSFPADLVTIEVTAADRRVTVPLLDDALLSVYEGNRLPAEGGEPWAEVGTVVRIEPVAALPATAESAETKLAT